MRALPTAVHWNVIISLNNKPSAPAHNEDSAPYSGTLNPTAYLARVFRIKGAGGGGLISHGQGTKQISSWPACAVARHSNSKSNSKSNRKVIKIVA